MGKINKYAVTAVLGACFLAAGYRLSATVTLAGGQYSVPVLSSLSGGGTASGGSLVLLAANMGGPTATGTRPSGGNLSISGGATSAAITLAAAKADLGTAHCYPVPFKPSSGHTKITFIDLTRSTRIKIYTRAGSLSALSISPIPETSLIGT